MYEKVHVPLQEGIESLPFRVRPARPDEAQQVYRLRRDAYAGRSLYLDEFKQALAEPDTVDGNPCAITFVAVCKATDEVLGTIRLACSLDVPDLLPLETPSDPCTEGSFSFADRFAVRRRVPACVTHALLKTVWLWALSRDTRWIVALAGAPLARHYQRWGGLSVRAGGQSFIVAKDLAEPVFLVAARLAEAQDYLATHNPKFFDDFISKVHLDINVRGLSYLNAAMNSC